MIDINVLLCLILTTSALAASAPPAYIRIPGKLFPVPRGVILKKAYLLNRTSDSDPLLTYCIIADFENSPTYQAKDGARLLSVVSIGNILSGLLFLFAPCYLNKDQISAPELRASTYIGLFYSALGTSATIHGLRQADRHEKSILTAGWTSVQCNKKLLPPELQAHTQIPQGQQLFWKTITVQLSQLQADVQQAEADELV